MTDSPGSGAAPALAPTSPTSRPERRSGAGRAILGAALIAFVLGAGTVGYVAWRGLVPWQQDGTVRLAQPASAPTSAPGAQARIDLAAQQGALEARIGMLEQRLAGINAQADAASGNAARAEALLVAFATRRAIDRGTPLGYLEDQLRLRFGDAQPNAVATIIDAGRAPVTLDQLLAGLDSLGPSLASSPEAESAWTRVKREVAGLFVFRRETAPSPAPQVVLQRARLLLEAGRTGEAVDALQRLPGAAEARDWFTAARRFDDVHRALDVLETAAVLDTRGLRDAGGARIDRPGPAATTEPPTT